MTYADTIAVVLDAPERISVRALELVAAGSDDVTVDVEWSGISTGTERLLWNGRMPHFPGFGYPLVPGYESVGVIVNAGANARRRIGERVFVGGASCYRDARGLFGATAKRLVVPSARAVKVADDTDESAVLLALAATARHALALGAQPPELIIGHGVLGRLLARLTICAGHPPPTVWEINASRRDGAHGYSVVDPAEDKRTDYGSIFDVSGDADVLDVAIARLRRGGEIVLAGFYENPLHFRFPPAFMREARMRVAAEWKPEDLAYVIDASERGALSLGDLISHRRSAGGANEAYRTAFSDAACLKMVLSWKDLS